MRFSSKNVLQKYSDILQLSRKELTFINQSYSFTAKMSAKGWFSYKKQPQQNKHTTHQNPTNQAKKTTTKPKQQQQKRHTTKPTKQTKPPKQWQNQEKDNFHLPLWVMLKQLHTKLSNGTYNLSILLLNALTA